MTIYKKNKLMETFNSCKVSIVLRGILQEWITGRKYFLLHMSYSFDTELKA